MHRYYTTWGNTATKAGAAEGDVQAAPVKMPVFHVTHVKVQSWPWMSLWSSNTERNGLDNNSLFMNLLPRKLSRDRAIAFSKLTTLGWRTDSRSCSSYCLPPAPASTAETPSVFQSVRSGSSAPCMRTSELWCWLYNWKFNGSLSSTNVTIKKATRSLVFDQECNVV